MESPVFTVVSREGIKLQIKHHCFFFKIKSNNVFLIFFFQDGKVLPSHIRELTATCAAMCASRSLRDVLQYVVPLTQSSIIVNEGRRRDSKVVKNETPVKSATVPRASHQRPPPVPPRIHRDNQQKVFFLTYKFTIVLR